MRVMAATPNNRRASLPVGSLLDGMTPHGPPTRVPLWAKSIAAAYVGLMVACTAYAAYGAWQEMDQIFKPVAEEAPLCPTNISSSTRHTPVCPSSNITIDSLRIQVHDIIESEGIGEGQGSAADYAGLIGKVGGLESEVDGLKGALKRAEDDKGKLAEEAAALKKRLAEVEETCKATKDYVTSAAQNATQREEAVVKSIDELATQVSVLKGHLEALEVDLTKTQSTQRAANTDLEAVMQQTLNATEDNIKAKARMEGEIADLKNSLKEVADQLEAAKKSPADYSSMQQQLDTLKEDLIHRQEQIQALQESLTEMQEKLGAQKEVAPPFRCAETNKTEIEKIVNDTLRDRVARLTEILPAAQGPSQAVPEDIKQQCAEVASQKAREELQSYALSDDGVDRRDYALINSGSRVVRDLTSETYTPDGQWLESSCYEKFGVEGNVCTPSEAITGGKKEPDKCWPFKGTAGNLTIKLSEPIVPGAVTLQHLPPPLRFNPKGAPRDFQVWGRKHTHTDPPTLLHTKPRFTYSIADQQSHVQTFELDAAHDPMSLITLEVLNNHGHPDYTCIHRFRVHRPLDEDRP